MVIFHKILTAIVCVMLLIGFFISVGEQLFFWGKYSFSYEDPLIWILLIYLASSMFIFHFIPIKNSTWLKILFICNLLNGGIFIFAGTYFMIVTFINDGWMVITDVFGGDIFSPFTADCCFIMYGSFHIVCSNIREGKVNPLHAD